ncbi:hypothetical protein F5B18DRAFT_650671 [Nemania serpens]|nr:hypothetical protein F5B18DRAFT_650671 [Nemania serpens]
MPPKRPHPNTHHGSKKPDSKKPRHPPDEEPPAEHSYVQEGRGAEWGPVPEYLRYRSPYPVFRNREKILELYAIPAGARPYVAPWVHVGEDASNQRFQHTAEEHLVQSACSVDHRMMARVRALGPNAWLGDEEKVWGRQNASGDQAASGPSGQSQQLQQQQYQQQQQQQQQQYQQQQYQQQQYHQQQYEQQQYEQQQLAPTSSKGKEKSAKAKGKEPERGHGGGRKGGGKRKEAYLRDGGRAPDPVEVTGQQRGVLCRGRLYNFTASGAMVLRAAAVAGPLFRNEFTQETFMGRRQMRGVDSFITRWVVFQHRREDHEQVVPYRPTVPPPLFLQQAGPLQPSPHDALVPRLLHDASREAIHGATSRPLPPPLLVILYHLHNLASGMVAFARAFPYCRRKI